MSLHWRFLSSLPQLSSLQHATASTFSFFLRSLLNLFCCCCFRSRSLFSVFRGIFVDFCARKLGPILDPLTFCAGFCSTFDVWRVFSAGLARDFGPIFSLLPTFHRSLAKKVLKGTGCQNIRPATQHPYSNYPNNKIRIFYIKP